MLSGWSQSLSRLECFISDLYSNRAGKGQHQAVRRAQHFARAFPYALKCDIKKYFPVIDHDILKQLIRRKIKSNDTLWLADLILDRSNPQYPVQDYYFCKVKVMDHYRTS